MKTHYYLDWYEDKGFSEKLASALQKDINERKSLVFISADKLEDQVEQPDYGDVYEKKWFDQAEIHFESYNFIHHSTPKEEAQRLIQGASVIFLCGGFPKHQMQLITQLELQDLIKDSPAVVMGTSAGGMNMSKSYVDEGKIYSGLALGPFSFEAHFDYADIGLVNERFALSKEMNVYVAADQDGAVIVKGEKIEIIGNVYLVAHSQIHQLAGI